MGASNQSNQEAPGSIQSSLGATTQQCFLLKQDRKSDGYKSIQSNKLTRVSWGGGGLLAKVARLSY